AIVSSALLVFHATSAATDPATRWRLVSERSTPPAARSIAGAASAVSTAGRTNLSARRTAGGTSPRPYIEIAEWHRASLTHPNPNMTSHYSTLACPTRPVSP